MITKPKKKLTPASIISQKKYAPTKTLKGVKRDGSTDKSKSQTKRREAFLPSDERRLGSLRSVEFGKHIGEGTYGDVFELKQDNHFVVKVPRGFVNVDNETPSRRMTRLLDSESEIDSEINAYENFNLGGKPFFSPAKVINLGGNDLTSRNIRGIIRPKVRPVVDYSKSGYAGCLIRLSDAQLDEVRQKLIVLTHQGIALRDGVQAGIDPTGRLLIYDSGRVEHLPRPSDFGYVMHCNNVAWSSFVARQRKNDGATNAERVAERAKYGKVE